MSETMKLMIDIEGDASDAVAATNAVNQSFQGLISQVRFGIRGFQLLENVFSRMEYSQSMLESAQESYTHALEEYGKGSREAWRAQQQLERVTMRVQNANLRAALSTSTLVMQLVMEADAQKLATLGRIGGAVASKIGAFADMVHNAVLQHKIILLSMVTGGLFAFAAAAGLAAASSLMMASGMRETEEEAERLKAVVGEAPSTGLVKGIEDLGKVSTATQINLGGFTLHLSKAGDFEREWAEAGRRVKRELKGVA